MGILYLAMIFRELATPPMQRHSFLAKGAVRETLGKAQAAYEAQTAIMDEIKNHFGASSVRIASHVERRHWERMNDAAGLKVYFNKDQQPAGWSIPSSWGDRQRYWDTRVYMPAEGSAEQQYLKEAVARIAQAVEAAYPTNNDPQRRHARTEMAGWLDWYHEALADMGMGKQFSDNIFTIPIPVGKGEFVVELTNRRHDVDVPPQMRDCLKLSSREADALKAEPERIARINQGKSALKLTERVFGYKPPGA